MKKLTDRQRIADLERELKELKARPQVVIVTQPNRPAPIDYPPILPGQPMPPTYYEVT